MTEEETMQIVKTMKRSKVVTVVNNATFSQTVTGADISMKEYNNFILTYKTGTATNSPTMDIVVQVKDSVGNYITHTSLTQVTTASSGYEEIFGLSADTIRVVCTYGGTGSFATTTVELTAAN